MLKACWTWTVSVIIFKICPLTLPRHDADSDIGLCMSEGYAFDG